MRRILLVGSLLAVVQCKALTPLSSQCEDENALTDIGRCLRPLLDLWETIRAKEEHAADLVFPLPFYTRESVLFLCDAYIQSKENCMNSRILARCDRNEMVSFVRSHMEFFCGENAPVALDSFNCISGSLLKSRQCQRLIVGLPIPSAQNNKCRGIDKFYECTEQQLRKDCGDESHAVWTAAITEFGCDIHNDNELSAYRILKKMNSTGKLNMEFARDFVLAEKPSALPQIALSVDDVDPHKVFLDDKHEVEIAFHDESESESQSVEVAKVADPPKGDQRESLTTTSTTAVPSTQEADAVTVSGTASDSIDPFAELNSSRIISSEVEVTDASTKSSTRSSLINHNKSANESTVTDVASIDEFKQSNTTDLPSILPNSSCNSDLRAGVTQCYRPVMDRLEEFRLQFPLFVRFPLFNISSEDVTPLCETFRTVVVDCLTVDMKQKCAGHETVSFVDSQLAFICMNMKTDEFRKSYDCVKDVVTKNEICLESIKGIHTLDTKMEDKCRGHQLFHECAGPAMKRTCGEEGMETFTTIQTAFGCGVSKTDEPEFTTSTISHGVATEMDSVDEVLLTDDSTSPITTSATSRTPTKSVVSTSKASPASELSTSETTTTTSETTARTESVTTTITPKNNVVEGVDVNPTTEKTNKTTVATPHVTQEILAPATSPNAPIQKTTSSEVTSDFIAVETTTVTIVDQVEEIEGSGREGSGESLLTHDISLKSHRAVLVNNLGEEGSGMESEATSTLLTLRNGNKATVNNNTVIVTTESTVNVTDAQIFTFPLSEECTQEQRDKSRLCIAPLMRTWVAIRQERPELEMVTFPLYKYTRTELLELCDGYANTFLCAGFEPITKCLNDELVRFARDHLGYICSPQNIARFLHHYDCIMNQEVKHQNCRKFVMGKLLPGKDERKCSGVSSYRTCIAPFITGNCPDAALKEFDESVTQFGCNISA